jgi:hypothetical protein
MLSLCGLSRSSFQSWTRSGLEIGNEAGAYGLNEVIALTVLVAVRDFLSPKHLVAAWREMVLSGEAERFVNAGRQLEKGGRFDLVVEPEVAWFRLARTDAELVDAVRTPSDPRPVVVIDAADRVRRAVGGFNRLGEETPRRTKKARGRPPSAARNVVRLPRRAAG